MSQSTRLTHGQTDTRTNRQNVDSKTVRMLRSRTVKIGASFDRSACSLHVLGHTSPAVVDRFVYSKRETLLLGRSDQILGRTRRLNYDFLPENNSECADKRRYGHLCHIYYNDDI